MKEKKHILITGDKEKTINPVKALLEAHGFSVDLSQNVEEAIEKYSSQFFDIVISDFNLEEKTGAELLKKMKEIDESAVVILLAEESDMNEVRPAIRSGVKDVLIRPFKDGTLLKSIKDVINIRKEKRELKQYYQEHERYVDEITETLRLQKEALEREQERSQGIIREAHFGIVFLDGETEEVYMLNKRGIELFRLKEDYENKFLSKNFRTIFPEKVVERIEEIVSGVKQEKNVIDSGEFVDEDVILRYVGYPVMIGEKVSSIVVTADDITEKKIMERQLLQSTRLAGIGELAAGVAHEINNPVAFVMSNTRMLEKYFSRINEVLKKYEEIEEELPYLENPQERKKKVEEVLELKKQLKIDKALKNVQEIMLENIDGLERVKKIVFDLKTFSHMDKTEMEEADINKIMTDTLNLVWNELKYKAEVVRELQDVPVIQCFPQQISQVFANILVNAAHAIPEKGIIEVRTYKETDGVVIEISDTGVGMDEETLKKIFNPFFSTKESDLGTGLGLSIVYRIIEKHNGTVDVESKAGKGTTFIIKLPVN
jgi:signal transduction histidine kinase/DNA-binding response OmpR family regulator